MPLYSFVVNVSASIIRLFLECWTIIIQALLNYLFLLPERRCHGEQRGLESQAL